MNYSSINLRPSRNNLVDVSRESDEKYGGMEFIEAEASLRNPQKLIHIERCFSFTNHLSVLSDEDLEVTAVQDVNPNKP